METRKRRSRKKILAKDVCYDSVNDDGQDLDWGNFLKAKRWRYELYLINSDFNIL